MAKRRKQTNRRDERDTFDIATQITPVLRPSPKIRLVQPLVRLPSSVKPKLNLIDDNRKFHPNKFTRPAKLVTGSPHRLKLKPGTKSHKSALPHQVGFSAPAKTLVCIRRKTRKQVLFALKRTKAGAGSRKRRNQWSDVPC